MSRTQLGQLQDEPQVIQEGGFDLTSYGEGSESSSIARGVDSLQASLYGFANAIGNLTGIDTIAEWGEEGVLRNIEEMSKNPPEIHSWDDVDSLSDFGTYWLEALGEQAPQLAMDAILAIGGTMVSGLGGAAAVVARREAMKGLSKKALAQIGKKAKRMPGMEKGFANFQALKGKVPAGALATAQTARDGAVFAARDLGQVAGKALEGVSPAAKGLVLSNIAQNAGETQMGFMGEDIEASGTALLAGMFKAGLDTLAPLQLLGIAKKAKVAPEALPQLFAHIGRSAGVTGLTEGATETAQTLVDHVAMNIHNPDFDMFDEAAMSELMTAATKGALVGGTMAGALSTVTEGRAFAGRKQALLEQADIEREMAARDVEERRAADRRTAQAQRDVASRINDPVPSHMMPESQETIDAQAEAVADPTSTKDTIEVTGGSPQPSDGILPDDHFAVPTENGVAYTTSEAKAALITATGGDEETMGQVLFNAPGGKRKGNGEVVVAMDARGRPIFQRITNEADMEADIAEAQRQAPAGGMVETQSVEQVLIDRHSATNAAAEGVQHGGVLQGHGSREKKEEEEEADIEADIVPEGAVQARMTNAGNAVAYVGDTTSKVQPLTPMAAPDRASGRVAEKIHRNDETAADAALNAAFPNEKQRAKAQGILDIENPTPIERGMQEAIVKRMAPHFDRMLDEETVDPTEYVEDTDNIDELSGQELEAESNLAEDSLQYDDDLIEGVDRAPRIRAPLNKVQLVGRPGTWDPVSRVGTPGQYERTNYKDISNLAEQLSQQDGEQYHVRRKMNGNKTTKAFEIVKIVGYKTREEAEDVVAGQFEPLTDEAQAAVRRIDLQLDNPGPLGLTHEALEDLRIERADLLKSARPKNKAVGDVRVVEKDGKFYVEEELLPDALASSNLYQMSQDLLSASMTTGDQHTEESSVDEFVEAQVKRSGMRRTQQAQKEGNKKVVAEMEQSIIKMLDPDGMPAEFVGTDVTELGMGMLKNQKTSTELGHDAWLLNAFTTGYTSLLTRGFTLDPDSVHNPIVAGDRMWRTRTPTGTAITLETLVAREKKQRKKGQDTQTVMAREDGESLDIIGDQITREQAERRHGAARTAVREARRALRAILGENAGIKERVVMDAAEKLSTLYKQRRFALKNGSTVGLLDVQNGRDVVDQKGYAAAKKEQDRLTDIRDQYLPERPTKEQTQLQKAELREAIKALRAAERKRIDAAKVLRRTSEKADFREKEELEGEGVEHVADIDDGFLYDRDDTIRSDGKTQINQANLGKITAPKAENTAPRPSVESDRPENDAADPIADAASERRYAARQRNAEQELRERELAVGPPTRDTLNDLADADRVATAAEVAADKRIEEIRKPLTDPDSGEPLARVIGYGNIGKNTVNFVSGILKAVGLGDLGMVVTGFNTDALEALVYNGHITPAQRDEVMQKFEDPERQAVFIPRGKTGVIIARGSKDRDFYLSTIGHEVGHGVFNVLEEVIRNPQTARERNLQKRLFAAYRADRDQDASYSADKGFKEWFADKIAAQARGLTAGKDRSLVQRYFQSSVEQLRAVFNKTKGQTNPRFHRNMKFENVVKAYKDDGVFQRMQDFGYGEIESITIPGANTAQTAGVSRRQLNQGIDMLADLTRRGVKFAKSAAAKMFDVHNRLQFMGAGELAAMIFKETNTRGDHQAFWNQVELARGQFRARIHEAIPAAMSPEARRNLFNQLTKELPTAQLTDQAKKMRKILHDFHAYMVEAGIPVGFEETFFPRAYHIGHIEAKPDRFVAILMSHGLPERDARQVVEDMITPREHNELMAMVPKKLQVQYERKIPSAAAADLVEAGYLTADPETALNNYIEKYTKYAEHYRAFSGYDFLEGYHSDAVIARMPAADQTTARAKNKRIIQAHLDMFELTEAEKPSVDANGQPLLDRNGEQVMVPKTPDEMYNDGLIEAQRLGFAIPDPLGGFRWLHPDSKLRSTMERVVNQNTANMSSEDALKYRDELEMLVKHAVGVNMKPDRHSFMYNAIGEIRAYESLRNLMFSGVASVPEIASAFQRAKGTLNAKQFAGLVWDSVRNYSDLKDMAELMGTLEREVSATIMQDMLSAYDGDGGKGRFFRKAIGPMFKFNGNQAVVNMSKIVAMKSGIHFLRTSAEKAATGDARALRYLQELNIDHHTVLRWAQDASYKGDKEAATQQGTSSHAIDAQRVRDAVNRFTNEAVLRPTAAERPSWADHPIGTFVYHLKTFAYSFSKNIVGGMYREGKARTEEGSELTDTAKDVALYALPSIMVFMAFGALSDELRERVKSLGAQGTWGANDESVVGMTGKWADRTGLFTSAPFFDPIWDTVTGNPSMNSVAFASGPTASHLYDLFGDGKGISRNEVVRSVPIISQLPAVRTALYE